jgi:hypothetical protein
MQTSHSPDLSLQLRLFRHAILNALPISPVTIAHLEARGINTSDLETRLIQNQEFTR